MRRLLGVVLGLLIVVIGGGVALFRADTGPVVSFATVGRDPWPLAFDETTSRAFVYNRSDGTVSTIDTVTGALVRTVPAGSQFAFMAVDQRTRRLFVSSGGDDTIYTLDARSGVVLRHVTDSNALTPRQPVVDEQTNRVFVGHRDPSIITMLDAHSGAFLRDIDACNGSFAIGVSVRTAHVFAKCNDGTSDMIDARTGRVLRTTPIVDGPFGWVVVDERTNRVFEGGGQAPQDIDVLDARTGALLRTLVNISPPTTPVVDPRTGRVYASLGGPAIAGSVGPLNRIAVLDGWTGTILRRFSVTDNPAPVAIDSRRGHLLVGSIGAVDSANEPKGYGVLSVLNSASGALVRRVPIGIFPADMAIDTHAGRVLVDNETVDLNNFSSGFSGPLRTSPPETWWARTRRRLLESVKRIMPGWLPFKVMVPPPPSPPTQGTVTTLDLSRL